MAGIDWKAEVADVIYADVLQELGDSVSVEVTEAGGRSATGKKVAASVTTYTGVAVQGGAATEADMVGNDRIRAGDVKFVVQLDDAEFEPSEKLDEKLLFGGRRYTVAGVRPVSPDGATNVVWVVFARRVN